MRPSHAFVRALGTTILMTSAAGLVCAPLSCAPTQVAEPLADPSPWTDAVVPAGDATNDRGDGPSPAESQPLDQIEVTGVTPGPEEQPEGDSTDGPLLDVTPRALDFADTSESSLLIARNLGGGSLPYRVLFDVSWIVVQGSPGIVSDGERHLTVSVNREGLAPGAYQCYLTVSTGDQQITVTVRMVVAGGEDFQAEPVLHVDKQEFDFGWGGAQDSFVVQNVGTGEMSYSIASNVEWAVPSAVEGTSAGEEDLIQVDVSREGLEPGEYEGLITVETPDNQSHHLTLRIEVLLSAAEWGFDPADSTGAFQSAVSSGASKLLIPNMGQPWVLGPIFLASDQEIYFEPGVVLLAKEGEFHGIRDCLLTARDIDNVLLWGYGATLRMRQEDYLGEDYEPAEWRHCLRLQGSRNIRVYGLRLENSGGDGICVGPWWNPDRFPGQNVEIRDCICDGNYRQGISVGTIETLRITNCVLRNTAGHPPQAGIDFEPDYDVDVLSDIVVENCVSEYNAGWGFVCGLHNLTLNSREVSIRFVNCRVTECGLMGYHVIVGYNGARGSIEFENCTAERTAKWGLAASLYSSEAVNVRFANCTCIDVATGEMPSPLCLEMILVDELTPPGQVEFDNCAVYDSRNRKFLYLHHLGGSGDLLNAIGNIDVFNPYGAAGWVQPPELVGLTVDFHEWSPD
jgi:hypothetical protein